MISGRIAGRDLAWIPIIIQDNGGSWQQLDVVLDTGFTGELALPERYVFQLGLTLNDETRAAPAVGQSMPVPAGNALVIWHGRRRLVRVLQAGTHPLVGMRLLWNHHITIDAVADGAVSITPLGG